MTDERMALREMADVLDGTQVDGLSSSRHPARMPQ